jgi:hypothetical protein
MKTKHSNNNNGTTNSRGRGRPKKDNGETVNKLVYIGKFYEAYV